MTDLALLTERNDERWKRAALTGRLDATRPARKAVAAKDRYVLIVRRLREMGSTMPESAWVFVAAAHYRESNYDFNTHLGQGDPLTRGGVAVKTVHVPAGRGPFAGIHAFEDAAVDALWFCAPYAAREQDWSISGMLTRLERYNGLAYAYRNRPSPYVWSGTTVYDPPGGPGGKVLIDRGPIVATVDKQLGVAALIKEILRLDGSNDLPKVDAPPTAPAQDLGELYDANVHDALWVQRTLNVLGTAPPLKEDGIYGGATRGAVIAYQLSHRLRVDGRVGARETIPSMLAELKKIGAKP
jgi:lysozyme family protein